MSGACRGSGHTPSREWSPRPVSPGSKDRLRVLFAASEVEPFAKTGGLADVASALPRVLAAKGHDVRVILPKYRGVEAGGPLDLVVPRLAVPIGDRIVEGALWEGRLGGAVPVYFVAPGHYYDPPPLLRPGDGPVAGKFERLTFFFPAAP